MGLIEGRCHCGATGWQFTADPGRVTACNCTLCRRYGSLWIYDYEGEGVTVSGPLQTYRRADESAPALANLFCPTCANLVGWRGLDVDAAGRRRMGVNIRLTPPEAVAGLPIKHLDALDSWEEVPGATACVRDLWF